MQGEAKDIRRVSNEPNSAEEQSSPLCHVSFEIGHHDRIESFMFIGRSMLSCSHSLVSQHAKDLRSCCQISKASIVDESLFGNNGTPVVVRSPTRKQKENQVSK